MTDKLISLQAAVDALARVAREKFNLSDEFNHYLAGLMDGEKAIRELPEAVIRCKDCKHWIPGYITDHDDFIPPRCGKYQQMVGHVSDDYCSYAERRERDEDF